MNIAKPLARLAVPVDQLRPHPRNPRRGDVDAIARSLERFGQVRPILATEDGTIIAGNHTYRAAVQLGWTKVAAVRFTGTQDEADAYLAADNRASDLGAYDDPALADLLKDLRDRELLDGTLYSDTDVDDVVRRVLSREGTLDVASTWSGMPAFESTELAGAAKVTIHFPTEEAADEFFRVIDRPRRSSMWWPVDDGHVGSDITGAEVVSSPRRRK